MDGSAGTVGGRFARAALLALVLCAILASRVFLSFEETRVKAIRAPVPSAEEGIRFAVPAASKLHTASRPLAVIWRIHNASGSPASFALASDGRRVCESVVPKGAVKRIDCSTDSRSLDFLISGPESPWSVEYAEVASHHGGTRRVHRVLILPGDREVQTASAAWIAIAAIVLFAIACVAPRPIQRRWLRQSHRVLCIGVWAAVLLAGISPWISQYMLAVSLDTWIVWSAILLLPRLRAAGDVALASSLATPARRRAMITACFLAAIAIAFARVTIVSLDRHHQGNYSGFLHISQRWFEPSAIRATHPDVASALQIEDGGGYDAQFFYFHAFDPLLRAFRDRPEKYAEFVDAPPYRFGRMGFPVLTRLASLNQPLNYPVTMVWLIVAGVLATAAGLAAIALTRNRTPLWGLAAAAVPGFWVSLQYGMPEPIAAAFLIWAIFFSLGQRWILAGVLFGCSLLIRETGLFALIGAAAFAFRRGHGRSATMMGVVGMLPYAAWKIYLGSTLSPAWGLDAYLYNPRIHGLPLAGLYELSSALTRGEYFEGLPILARAAGGFAALFLGAVGCAGVIAIRARNAIAAVPAVYALIALCLTYPRMWDHVANVERGTYEIFVLLPVAALTLPDHSAWGGRLAAGLAVLSVVYVLFWSIDAELLRHALIPL